jgi:translin
MQINFDKVFGSIREQLDKLDADREKILRRNREIIRSCSEIIKSIHRNDLQDIEAKIKETKESIAEIEKNARKTENIIRKNYLTTVNQEFTEAVTFFHYATGKEIPTYQELNVNPYEYILGLADLIGELKRMVLNSIRKDDYVKAEEIYEFMDELYQKLFSLDYPSGMLPGFRKKVDVARNIVRRTLELIITGKKTDTLTRKIGKLLDEDKWQKK